MLPIEYFKTIDSTNEEAKRRVQNPDFAECVLVADTQTKGRGRYQRAWYSEPGTGLYYTLLLKPEAPLDAESLPFKIGQTVSTVIKAVYGIDLDLEWPNDLILDHKKAGGILVESGYTSSSPIPNYLIIGIGLNLNHTQFPKELSAVAISFFQKTGRHYDRDAVLAPLTDALIQLICS